MNPSAHIVMENLIGGLREPITYVVGIGGGTASGKSMFVRRFVEGFQKYDTPDAQKVQIVTDSLDNYYFDVPKGINPKNYNFDEVSALDIKKIGKTIKRFVKGQEVFIPTYDFGSHRAIGHAPVEPNHFADRVIFITEGIHAFTPDLLPLYNLKIWIHADADVRFKRRLARDIHERGRTADFVKAQWDRDVQTTFEKYEPAYRAAADFTITNNHNGLEQISDDLIDLYCRQMLGLDPL